MDTTFGINFAECFEGLSDLLSESENAGRRPGEVSRAKEVKAGPACIGPEGIFPDVKVAEPVGNYRIAGHMLQIVSSTHV